MIERDSQVGCYPSHPPNGVNFPLILRLNKSLLLLATGLWGRIVGDENLRLQLHRMHHKFRQPVARKGSRSGLEKVALSSWVRRVNYPPSELDQGNKRWE